MKKNKNTQIFIPAPIAFFFLVIFKLFLIFQKKQKKFIKMINNKNKFQEMKKIINTKFITKNIHPFV
jgi:hypothetical protein